MKKNTILGLAYGAGALALTAVGFLIGDHGMVFGVDAAAVSDSVRGNFNAMADLLGGGAYLGGAGFGIQSALKFKAHNENPQQNPLSKPLTYGVVAGALLALPTFLTTGSDTMFSNGGEATHIAGGQLR